jgi:tRNA A-37 threonylcarbamoyl transferase component Bud32
MIEQIIQILKNKFKSRIELLENLQNTRGIFVLKILLDSKLYALKVYSKENDKEQTFRNSTLLNEIQVLKGLDNSFNYYYDSEDNENYTWLLTYWIDGIDSNKFLKELTNKKDVYTSINKIVQKFIKLYDVGYLHGDIQPKHIKLTSEGNVEILDFGLARKTNDSGQIYKGGLVHFNSPEIAEAMLGENENIEYNLSSEIYFLGSVLFYNLTGYTSTDYGSTDYKSIPFKTKLEYIINGNRNSFKSTNYLKLPELEQILDTMLEPNPINRPMDLASISKKMERLITMCYD